MVDRHSPSKLPTLGKTRWRECTCSFMQGCCFMCLQESHRHILALSDGSPPVLILLFFCVSCLINCICYSQPVRLRSLDFSVVTWLLVTHLHSASITKAAFFLLCLCRVRTAHKVKLLTLADTCLRSQHLTKCLLHLCSKFWKEKKKKKTCWCVSQMPKLRSSNESC